MKPTMVTTAVLLFTRDLRVHDHPALAAACEHADRDYRSRAVEWRDDADGLRAWQDGRTGVPIVDAGMRQLLREAGCTTGPGWSRCRS